VVTNISIFRSLKFKLPLALVLVSYLFSLLFSLALTISGSNQPHAKELYFNQWFDQTLTSAIEELLAAQPLAKQKKITATSQLNELLNPLINKSFTLQQNKQLNSEDVLIRSVAIVDKKAQLVAQWGEELFTAGDIGSQLMISARDDLADALIGHYNSGIESISKNNKLIIKPLKNTQQEIIGAVVSKQQWRKGMLDTSLISFLNITPLTDLLIYSLLPLILVIPVSFTIVFFATKQLRQHLNHLYSTLTFWTKGELNHQIEITSNDEIGQCLSRLNIMATQLKELIEDNNQLASLNERQYLAAELHDTVKQNLFSNNLILASCKQLINDEETKQAQIVLQQVINSNQQAFSQVNQLISTLQPKSSAESFSDELLTQLTFWQDNNHLEVNKTIRVFNSCPIQLQHIIKRCLGEILQNISKHSQATRVHLSIEQEKEKERIIFEVVDNGQWQKHFNKGQGLSLMQHRVENIGGSFNANFNHQTPLYSGLKISICLPI